MLREDVCGGPEISLDPNSSELEPVGPMTHEIQQR